MKVHAPAAVAAHHNFDPCLAAIDGSTIIPKRINQEKTPILSSNGSSGFIDFGNRTQLNVKSRHDMPTSPKMFAFRCDVIQLILGADRSDTDDYRPHALIAIP
jgi:hypothetical protein